MLLITHSCNLKCVYCYEHKDSHVQMTVSRAKKILTEQICKVEDKYDAFEVQFMGGEPLLNFGLIREVSEWLWSVSWQKKLLTVFIPTNGTILSDEIREWFTRNKERICLGLSFDGDKNMQNINRSSSANLVDLSFFASTWPNQSVKLTISPATINSLFSGVNYLWQYNIKNVSADLAMGSNVKWERQHLNLLRIELQKFVDYYLNENRSSNTFSMMNISINKLLNQQSEKKQCNCGESLICVDENGHEYPCHLFSPVALSTKSQIDGLSDIDFNKHEFFENSLCRECFLNSLCTNHCYGMNYKTYGIISKNSPFHCKAFKIIFMENCRLNYYLALKHNDISQLSKIKQIINTIH